MSFRRVVHFHVDHFEPFGLDMSGAVIGALHVQSFLDRARTAVHARNASLFVSPHAYQNLPNTFIENAILAHDGLAADHFALMVPWYGLTSRGQAMENELLYVLGGSRHDLQVHVHHETWTSGTVTKTPVDERADSLRLDSYLQFYLAKYGFSGKRWAFIHGCWALAASDRSICNIVDEIGVLSRRGCVADFSFPAGRRHCSPSRLSVPFTVRNEAVGEKCYDRPESDPAPLSERAWTPGRFVIWASSLDSDWLSLEMLADSYASQNEIVEKWLGSSTVIGETLYVKTHAHSLKPDFWASASHTRTPILSSRIHSIFDRLQRVCDEQKIELSYLSASQVLDELGVKPTRET